MQAFAYASGAQNAVRFNMFVKQDSTLNKDQMIMGMQYAMNADTTQSYLFGMQLGQQLIGQIKYMESMGIKVDRNKFVNEFKRAFLSDSINQEAVNLARVRYENGMSEIRKARKAYEDSIKSNAPEAKANAEKGHKYLESVMKADPEVKTTASGLGYKIENAGAENKLTPRDRISFRYVGKTTDGKVFDKTEDEPSSIIVSQLVYGMQEGLQMLGEGGKATFYIPANSLTAPTACPKQASAPTKCWCLM